MTQKEINLAFRKMYHSFEPKQQAVFKLQILKAMNWSEDQLKNRLTGRTNVRIYEAEAVCIKCRINIDDYFPGLGSDKMGNELKGRSPKS